MVEIKNFLLDLVFPRYCLGCLKLMADNSNSQICANCRSSITLKGDFTCAFCSAPVVLGKVCPFCVRSFYLDRLLVATTYEQPLVEKMLKCLKYRFVKSLADDMAFLMTNYLEKKILLQLKLALLLPVIVPVPLYRLRLNWRGFNQSELLAEKMAAYFKWQYQSDLLARTKNQPPQADIKDRNSRIKNMNGVFECQKPEVVAGKTILLIDDVSTTGSTLNDCARALKGAGAKEVIGFVFARNR